MSVEAKAPTGLPTPRLTVTPAKSGYPVDGGSVDLLVTLGVDLPQEDVDRKPIALALVLDRSGSMSGEPLEAAKTAACAAIEMLLPTDHVAVVAYDDKVDVVAPLHQAGADRGQLLSSVRALRPGGSTALYAGWVEGLSQAMACQDPEAVARVVLLSDGMANVGLSDASSISADVAQAAGHGVTTTAMGFGRSYDEDLLRSMADAGTGNYVFIEGEGQVVEAFQHELSGLSALRGRNVRLEPSAGFTLSSTTPSLLPQVGSGVRLPDMVGGLERELLVTATFAPHAPQPELSVMWDDALTGEAARITLSLDMRPVSRTELEGLQPDERVATAVALARIAESKRRLADAFRRGQPADIRTLLEQLRAELNGLPHGAERDAEEREVARLRQLTESRQTALAARYSEKFARDRLHGTSDAKRMAQFLVERDVHEKKMAILAAASAAGEAINGPSPAGSTRRAQTAARPLAETNFHGAAGAVRVQVILGDITDQVVDVLVNSTNRNLFGNAGVDGAVHRRGGPQLTEAARQIGGLDLGGAAFTPGFALPARWVVHAVATPWLDGSRGELGVLSRAYRSAYTVAGNLNARSLAVAALGTGSYATPPDLAARVAVDALHEALATPTSFRVLRFVTIDPNVANAFAQALRAGPTRTTGVVN